MTGLVDSDVLELERGVVAAHHGCSSKPLA
jgi:hypothetical protein